MVLSRNVLTRLVSLIGAYVIFGVLYRRLVIGATGWKQFPNHEFWGAVINAIAVRPLRIVKLRLISGTQFCGLSR